jgi:DNA polymerase (family 10)
MDTLTDMEIGVSAARKGWIKESSVLNAMSLEALLEYLHNRDS